jgi:hypothetical protein
LPKAAGIKYQDVVDAGIIETARQERLHRRVVQMIGATTLGQVGEEARNPS